MQFVKKPFVYIALIMLLGLLAYSNAFRVPFHFDDKVFIVKNPIIKDFKYFVNPSLVKNTDVSEDIKIYIRTRPVGALTLWANYRLGGLNVWGYHAVNIAVHMTNAVLVYCIVLLTFSTPALSESILVNRRRIIALFSGLLFVAHPVETEAVIYITQRQVLLAAMFYLLSLFLYVRWRLRTIAPGKEAAFWSMGILYFLSIVSCVLAMKTKENTFTLPLTIALYEIIFFRNGLKRRALYLAPILASMLIIPLTYLNIYLDTNTWNTLKEIASIAPDTAHPDYLYTQFTVTIENLRLILLPIGLHIDHYAPVFHSFFNPAVFISFFFIISFLGLGALLFYYSRVSDNALLIVSAGIFWYFLTFAVESSFLPINEMMVEYRIYLPSVGILVSAVVLYFHQLRNIKWASIALLAVILVLAIVSHSRNVIWQNEISLWEDSVSKSPMKPRAHYNLGKAYERKGLLDKAIEHFDTTISLDPSHLDAHISIGNALMSKAQPDKAMRHFMRALMLNPENAGARNNLGNALKAMGQMDQAIIQYKRAAELDPSLVNANLNMGVYYFTRGELDKAILYLERVNKVNPGISGVHYKLGVIYNIKDDPEKSIPHFRAAIEIDPRFARAHHGLGLAYYKKGLMEEALRELKTALRLDPEYSEARRLQNEILAKFK